MAQIGPSFGDEVFAAGIGGLPFSWSPDGQIFGREKLTPQQNVTLDQVLAAHDPTKKSKGQAHHEDMKNESDVQWFADMISTWPADDVDAWLDANVTNVPQVRDLLKAVVKYLALKTGSGEPTQPPV